MMRKFKALSAALRSHDTCQVWDCIEWIDRARLGLDAGLGVLESCRLATASLAPGKAKETFLRVDHARFAGSGFSEALVRASINAESETTARILVNLQRAHSLGSPLADVLLGLRITLSAEQRAVREERIGRLPVTMLFPLAVFVLPAFLLLVCAPIAAEFFASIAP